MTSDSRAYRNYLLILLMVVLAFNYVDRWALAVVLEDIKQELVLSDTQLGLLTGIAFTVFYAIMGIPIARWADRGNRVTIITITTALWSAAVVISGAAISFVQLLLVRVGVAIGEAGCIPPAHSLIADHFSRADRPRAVGRYMLGVPLSLVIGYFAAGWFNELYGWRATFVLIGVPGVILAALAHFTLREPRLNTATSTTYVARPQGSSPRETSELPLSEVFATLWASATFRHLLLCFSIWYFFGYGIQQWEPAFFIRSHGLQTGELGTWLAVIYGAGGGIGAYVGGEVATRYAAANERLQLRACACAFASCATFLVIAHLVPNHYLALGALGLAAFGGTMAQGPMLATMQTLVPSHMRALSIALVYLFANLVGMGLGPLAAGALSDALSAQWGERSLQFALLMLSPGYFWAAWHLWRASRTVARDVAVVQGAHEGSHRSASLRHATAAE